MPAYVCGISRSDEDDAKEASESEVLECVKGNPSPRPVYGCLVLPSPGEGANDCFDIIEAFAGLAALLPDWRRVEVVYGDGWTAGCSSCDLVQAGLGGGRSKGVGSALFFPEDAKDASCDKEDE